MIVYDYFKIVHDYFYDCLQLFLRSSTIIFMIVYDYF